MKKHEKPFDNFYYLEAKDQAKYRFSSTCADQRDYWIQATYNKICKKNPLELENNFSERDIQRYQDTNIKNKDINTLYRCSMSNVDYWEQRMLHRAVFEYFMDYTLGWIIENIERIIPKVLHVTINLYKETCFMELYTMAGINMKYNYNYVRKSRLQNTIDYKYCDIDFNIDVVLDEQSTNIV